MWFWFLILGTIWSCPDIPATVIPGLISAGAESVVESAEEFLDDLSDNSSVCIGTIWSCPDLPATVIPCLISANVESAEDFTVDLFDNSSECIGTSLVYVLLPDMVLVALDSRISAIGISKLLLAPEQKLHTIRAHPPVIASWAHYNKAGEDKLFQSVTAEKPFQFPSDTLVNFGMCLAIGITHAPTWNVSQTA
ncbi:hypothetical protein ACFX2I_028516 [Malus domestica]